MPATVFAHVTGGAKVEAHVHAAESTVWEIDPKLITERGHGQRRQACLPAVRCALVADRYGRPRRTRMGILARGWLVRLGLGVGLPRGLGR